MSVALLRGAGIAKYVVGFVIHALREAYSTRCQNLAPTYEQLADAYSHAKDKVIIAKVDADGHRSLGQRFGVSGFPSAYPVLFTLCSAHLTDGFSYFKALKWFDGTGADPVTYDGGRELETFTTL